MSLVFVLVIRHQSVQLELLGIPHASGVAGASVLARPSTGSLGSKGFGVGGSIPEVDEHVGEEEREEGQAIEDKNIRDMIHAGVGDKVHLLLRGTHEEETGSVEQLHKSVNA